MRNVLSSLAIILVGIIYVPAKAQQKRGVHRANFSGEWRSKESISMGGNIVCTYSSGDRMLSKTMNIADHVNFLTIGASSSFPGEAPVKSQEILNFDGKTTEINHGPGKGKTFTVKLSADGQTMTVNSIVRLMTPAPYHIDVQKELVVYVTEVWKLSNDGKSITVLANAKSNMFDKGRSWTTIFNKATWYSKYIL